MPAIKAASSNRERPLFCGGYGIDGDRAQRIRLTTIRFDVPGRVQRSVRPLGQVSLEVATFGLYRSIHG